MDDFLMKLYREELEKNAGAGQKQLFDALPVSDLEAYLGIEKVAVGGPVEPEVSPAFRKAFQARETKGKEAQREAIKENSSTETQLERNIAPLKAGETIPERNITPHHPQISASAKSLPDRDYASQGETKQAAYEWADQMGRGLAHMVKKAAEEGVAKHRKDKKKESCMMGKAGAAMMGVKLAHQIPEEMMPALIETTAAQMVKEAKLPAALRRAARIGEGGSHTILEGRFGKEVGQRVREAAGGRGIAEQVAKEKAQGGLLGKLRAARTKAQARNPKSALREFYTGEQPSGVMERAKTRKGMVTGMFGGRKLVSSPGN